MHYERLFDAAGLAGMIGYCELCKRLGDLNECSVCRKRACGSCLRTLEGKRYCLSCMKNAAKETPEAAGRRLDALAVVVLLFIVGSAILLYPKYVEFEKRAQYSDFNGFVPVEHNRTSGGLVVLFENQINQPVTLTSVKSTGNCTFEGKRVEPNARVLVSCDNSSAARLSLEYSVGGFAISASGRIPLQK